MPGELPDHDRWLKIFNSSLIIDKHLHFKKNWFQNLSDSLEPFKQLLTTSMWNVGFTP